MMTIVEYTLSKRALNAYPRKIISPPFSGRCCHSSMEPVGRVEEEGGWPFVYFRCRVCGFTVRRFASREGMLEELRIWKKGGRMPPDAA